MQDPHLDLFSVALMLLSLAVGPQLAPALAAYIIIFIGALLGTLPALKNRAPEDRTTGALFFVCALVAWSCGLTVSVSLLIQSQFKLGWQWTLFPVAFSISALGEKWLEWPKLVWEIATGIVKGWAGRIATKGDDK